jgi:hypothetical protein
VINVGIREQLLIGAALRTAAGTQEATDVVIVEPYLEGTPSVPRTTP